MKNSPESRRIGRSANCPPAASPAIVPSVAPATSAVSSAAPIRLILVDDHAVLRAGLANVLNFDPGLRVVAEADDEGLKVYLFCLACRKREELKLR